MSKPIVKRITILIMLIFSSLILVGKEGMKHNLPVLEILKWKSKEGISDADMISSVHAMEADLKSLKGFLHQSLYKSSNEEWVDIYYWETEEDAHNSNEKMANKESFKNLIELIEPDSVSIEVLNQLQSSGKQTFEH